MTRPSTLSLTLTVMLSVFQQLADLSGHPALTVEMDEDQLSSPGSPVGESGATPGVPEKSQYEKQLASLSTYLASVPYECESVDEMNNHLAHIIDKLYAVTSARLWHLLPEWNGLLVACVPFRCFVQSHIH